MITSNGHLRELISERDKRVRIRLEPKPRGMMTAVTHGLASECPVIHGEDEDDWDALAGAVLLDLQPCGPVETLLAERIALLMWRLRRVTRFEVAATAATRTAAWKVTALHGDFHGPTTDEVMATTCLPTGRDLRKIQRFEAHLDRCRSRALGELLELQQRRRV